MIKFKLLVAASLVITVKSCLRFCPQGSISSDDAFGRPTRCSDESVAPFFCREIKNTINNTITISIHFQPLQQLEQKRKTKKLGQKKKPTNVAHTNSWSFLILRVGSRGCTHRKLSASLLAHYKTKSPRNGARNLP